MRSVVLLEDFDFIMKERQLELITRMHNQGKALNDISDEVNRNSVEVLLALIHQSTQGKITRPLYGRKEGGVG